MLHTAPKGSGGGNVLAQHEWVATCTCEAEPKPATVLDPFTGSGTVGSVAQRFGRSFVGCELNPEYISLIQQRVPGITRLSTENLEVPVCPS